jgi:hypothetical protein
MSQFPANVSDNGLCVNGNTQPPNMISDSGSSRTSKFASTLNANTSKPVSATERLSSGLRILTASDNAAGLSLSKKNASDGALYRTAMGNISTGQALVNVPAAAIDGKGFVRTELLALPQQATSTLLSTTQRQSLETEAQLLGAPPVEKLICSRIFGEEQIRKTHILDPEADKQRHLIINDLPLYSKIPLTPGEDFLHPRQKFSLTF